uniref:Uncharacterized protein n=1 Tax=Leersia perrieri TaxID=77586 RepID=A0A0D9XZC1_9ORYZ
MSPHCLATLDPSLDATSPPAAPTTPSLLPELVALLSSLSTLDTAKAAAAPAAPVVTPPPALPDDALAALHAQATAVLNVKAIVPMQLDLAAGKNWQQRHKETKGCYSCQPKYRN